MIIINKCAPHNLQIHTSKHLFISDSYSTINWHWFFTFTGRHSSCYLPVLYGCFATVDLYVIHSRLMATRPKSSSFKSLSFYLTLWIQAHIQMWTFCSPLTSFMCECDPVLSSLFFFSMLILVTRHPFQCVYLLFWLCTFNSFQIYLVQIYLNYLSVSATFLSILSQ